MLYIVPKCLRLQCFCSLVVAINVIIIWLLYLRRNIVDGILTGPLDRKLGLLLFELLILNKLGKRIRVVSANLDVK